LGTGRFECVELVQELVGRLTALDPEASASLKVIAYFDALVDGHASPEVMLRGAAVLSGCAAGFVTPSIVMRVDSTGLRTTTDAAPPADTWPSHAVSDSARAWLERSGEAHANDNMILERLAIALSITLERSGPVAARRRAIETVLDARESVEARAEAAGQLRLSQRIQWRVDALPSTAHVPDGHQTVVVTPAGAVRAVIRAAEDDALYARAGIGVAASSDLLPRSWHSAVIALRLTTARSPLVHADDLGSFVLLADAADGKTTEYPDVAALAHAIDHSDRTLPLVETVLDTESLRAASVELGVHHSTLQAKVAELSSALGFDLRSPAGRTRLSLALRLYLLDTNHFD
jgi:PucR C-terminal helix-turn-helix domain